MEEIPSNNESQEVSRRRSSVEVSVMEMERMTEQIYQLLKLKLNLYTKLRVSSQTRTIE